MKDFSIVIPVYYNAESLPSVEKELREKVLQRNDGLQGEIVFVDDGSRDSSFEILSEIYADNPQDIRVFKLSKNFGQVNAIWCGYTHCDNTVIFMSADGQDPVEVVNKMLDVHFNSGKEIVIATRESRDDSMQRKITSSIAYWLMKKLADKDMPTGGFDFCLLGNKARKALISCWQPHTFIQERILKLGFPREMIGYHRNSRKSGKSRWTFSKKITYMIDGILGHSYIPIRFMSFLGGLFSTASFLLAIYFLISYFAFGTEVRGLTPIVLLILFIGGVEMIMIGIIGEYLWRVLAQARNDPPFIIEKILE